MKTVIGLGGVGRSGPPIPDVELPGKAGLMDILWAVEKVAIKRLRSEDWEIGINEAGTEWNIEFGRYGNGTVEYVEEEWLKDGSGQVELGE
jgi:hypothetical protein